LRRDIEIEKKMFAAESIRNIGTQSSCNAFTAELSRKSATVEISAAQQVRL